MPVTATTAPAAPARMGEPVEPAAMSRYLTDLREWRDRRRVELDELDRRALGHPDAPALTGDITLSMALWQAVAARHDELLRVWDGGRVGPVELRRLSAVVWGRRSAGSGAASLAVSLPEACRLSDALASQLRLRLSLEEGGADLAGRLRALRAAVERVRDLVVAEPAGPAGEAAARRLRGLDRRLADVVERAGRGADVGGLVGPLEADAALAERDLIVAAAARRDDERDRARATALREELLARAAHVERVVEECARRVTPAPRLGVPRVEALGPVPADPDEVDAYLLRLDAVGRALDQVERTYAAPLAEVDGLVQVLDAYRAKAVHRGLDARPEVADLYRHAHALVTAVPVDLPRARAVVAAYQTLLADAPPAPHPGRSS